MRVFGLSMLGVTLGGCGARTELDDTGYYQEPPQSGTAPLVTVPVVPSATAPSINPPIVAPAPPVAIPPDFTMGPPVVVAPVPVPPSPPPTPPTTPGPCSDADAAQPLGLRLVIPAPPAGGPLQEPLPPPNVDFCGDGALGETEYCDDGNAVGGDGCSPSCQVEIDGLCPTPGQPCVSATACGDGFLAGPEQCEPASSPGCDANCNVEVGWTCPAGSACFTRCGDGIAAGGEQCDDGNLDVYDGCDATCGIEWAHCWSNVNGCGTFGAPYCGNGVLDGGEACDEGGVTQTCGYDCQLKPQCSTNGQCLDTCGDGVVAVAEACDDGNRRDDDGCSAACAVEVGYSCTNEFVNVPALEPVPPLGDGGTTAVEIEQTTSICSPICGDGVQQRGEECDPIIAPSGARNPICNADCTLVDAYCGNGIVDGAETCDDGVNSGDGPNACRPTCQNVGYCGDGKVDPSQGETCDFGRDGNQGAYGTCTSNCRLAARCGDAVVQACGNEACDDGNRRDRDGCSASCRPERRTP